MQTQTPSKVSTGVLGDWQLIQLWAAVAVVRNGWCSKWHFGEQGISFVLSHISLFPLTSYGFSNHSWWEGLRHEENRQPFSSIQTSVIYENDSGCTTHCIKCAFLFKSFKSNYCAIIKMFCCGEWLLLVYLCFHSSSLHQTTSQVSTYSQQLSDVEVYCEV